MAEPAKYVQPTAYDASGQPVDQEAAPQLVAEGKAFYQKGARVYVRNDTGQLGSVDSSEAGAAPVLSQGQLNELLAKRDAESTSGLVKTGAEGLVRGAALGPEQFYDAEGRAAAKARQQYNPTLSAGSEFAGAVGGTVAAGLLTGGAGAWAAGEMTAGRLAAMAGRGVLTPFRAAAALGEGAEAAAGALGAGEGILGAGLKMGARGLAEGAVMGARHEVSQAALQDVPLTAERLLAGAWDGAKVGGAFGLGLGVLGAGVGKAGRAIMGRVSETGEDIGAATGSWAENAMAKQMVGNNGKIYDQMTNFGQDMARPARIGRKLLDADMPVAPRAALRRAEELVRDAGKRMEGVVETVDQAGITADAGAVLKAVDEQVAKIREVPFGDAQAVADRIEKNLAPFRERYAAKSAAQANVAKAYDYNAEARAFDDLMTEVSTSVSSAEKAAIKDYTTTSYGHMNEAARNPGDYLKRNSAGQLMEKQIKNTRLQSILEKEVAAGRVYRGEVERIMNVSDDVAKGWIDDGAVTNSSFWSTSADPAFNGTGNYNTRLHITHSDAVPVSKFSQVASEKEALIPPGRTFFVNKEEMRDGVRHIWLEQAHSGDAAFASRLTNEAGATVPSAEKASQLKLSELWNLRKELDKSISFETAQRGPAKEALMDVRNAFRSELDATVARAADSAEGNPALLKTWKAAAEDYGDMSLIKKSLKQLINRQSKNRMVSASDYGTGGAAGLLMGILSGNPVAGMATSAIAGGVHKLVRERGLGVMAKIADRTGGVASSMENAAKVAAMVETPKRLAAPVAVNVAKQFERYSAALAEANADPAKFAERMATATADLSIRTPELAQQVQKTMLGDLAYLNKLHPQPASRKGNTLTPLAVKPEFYSFNQQKAFVDAAVALDNPLSVFDAIAHGDLPMTGIAALKARRPALFGEMRQTVVKYTMTRKKELPFSRRILLGTGFDFPADWSMANVASIQTALATPEKKPNDPTAAPSKIGKDPGQDIEPGGF